MRSRIGIVQNVDVIMMQILRYVQNVVQKEIKKQC